MCQGYCIKYAIEYFLHNYSYSKYAFKSKDFCHYVIAQSSLNVILQLKQFSSYRILPSLLFTVFSYATRKVSGWRYPTSATGRPVDVGRQGTVHSPLAVHSVSLSTGKNERECPRVQSVSQPTPTGPWPQPTPTTSWVQSGRPHC